VTWTPAPDYRYALGPGMNGVDVWAIQLNLITLGFTLAADGAFGPITQDAVKRFQGEQKLPADGVCGPVTQQAMCLTLSDSSSKQNKLPPGMLRGLMANESGMIIPAYSKHPADAGFDLGAYQQSFTSTKYDDTQLAAAYNVRDGAMLWGKTMRSQKNAFRRQPHVSTDKYAWQLAALNHNWPAAAANLATHGTIFWPASGQDTEPLKWVEVATGGRLHTAQEWCAYYISKATVFVTAWPA
jgi:peptidoglycan hydrolase-like protein with peptidoglycan-binding domain